jgi:hypothetical protein
MLFTEKRSCSLFFLAIIVILVATSCSSGPPAPKMGTPPFYWGAAGETFAKADYLKAADHLEQLVKTDNEYTQRALPWRLALTAGMTNAYAELADVFETGSRANRSNPTPFRKNMAENRALAGRRALQFAETFLKFNKGDHTQDVPLDFTFPTGSANKPFELTKIGNGVPLPDTQLETVQRRAVERAVLLATAAVVGAPDDVAKAQSIFQAGNVKVPHDVFALAMVKYLHEQAQLFTRAKLDQPERVELFCNQALETLKHLKPSKETKELTAKVEKTLKTTKAK